MHTDAMTVEGLESYLKGLPAWKLRLFALAVSLEVAKRNIRYYCYTAPRAAVLTFWRGLHPGQLDSGQEF